MSRGQRGRRRRERHGLLDSLIGGATEIVQSVANEVAPGVVGALDVDEVVQRVDVQAIVDKVDIEGVVDKVDVQAIVDKVDIQAVMEQVDLQDLVTHDRHATAGQPLASWRWGASPAS